MSAIDTFDNATGVDANLGARTNWTCVDGTAGQLYIVPSGSLLSVDNGDTNGSSFTFVNQGTSAHYSEAVWGANGAGAFMCVRLTDRLNFIGVRNSGTEWSVYKRVAGTFTQLGSDYAVAPAGGEVVRLSVDAANLITLTIDGTPRCLGAGVTDTFNASETNQGLVSRGAIGALSWISSLEVGASASGPVITVPILMNHYRQRRA